MKACQLLMRKNQFINHRKFIDEILVYFGAFWFLKQVETGYHVCVCSFKACLQKHRANNSIFKERIPHGLSSVNAILM
jgi:hypothetical protein